MQTVTTFVVLWLAWKGWQSWLAMKERQHRESLTAMHPQLAGLISEQLCVDPFSWELLTAHGVKVLMHTGAASSTTFAAPVTVFTQSPNANVVGGNIIAIADVDGDGLNDLIITDPGPTGGMSTGVYVLIQNPAALGTFLAPVSYAIANLEAKSGFLSLSASQKSCE